MAHTVLDVQGVCKDYGTFRALTDINLSVENGEFVALVGPSGCGKTSLLKILAGFEYPTEGVFKLDGKDMQGVPPSQRPTRMVFQKLALFPHKTVEENIRFPLRIAKVDAVEQEKRIQEMFTLMHLKPEYRTRYPSQLSGGEQQRVALARALVSHPEVLLLDEPMSALDAKLKKSLQSELKRLHREIGTTFVLVTHDLEEAMMLADRICVVVAGKIEQIGRPADIYTTPASRFVAGFIGDTNFLPVTLDRSGQAFTLTSKAGHGAPVQTSADRVAGRVTGADAALLVRPEDGNLTTERPTGDTWYVEGVVAEKFTKGSSTQFRLDVDNLSEQFVLERSGFDTGQLDVGQRVYVQFDPASLYVVEAAA